MKHFQHIQAGISATVIGLLLLLGSVANSATNVVTTATPVDIHIEAVRSAESRGNQLAVSPVGAIGSMQVMPTTADDPGFNVAPAKKNADGSYNLNDIDRLGEEYLHAMMKRYNNDFEAALIAYNAGPGNADKWTLNGRDYDLLPDRVQTEAYVERAYTHYFHLLAEVA